MGAENPDTGSDKLAQIYQTPDASEHAHQMGFKYTDRSVHPLHKKGGSGSIGPRTPRQSPTDTMSSLGETVTCPLPGSRVPQQPHHERQETRLKTSGHRTCQDILALPQTALCAVDNNS